MISCAAMKLCINCWCAINTGHISALKTLFAAGIHISSSRFWILLLSFGWIALKLTVLKPPHQWYCVGWAVVCMTLPSRPRYARPRLVNHRITTFHLMLHSVLLTNYLIVISQIWILLISLRSKSRIHNWVSFFDLYLF